MKSDRRAQLVNEHLELRKAAFERALPHVDAFFKEAQAAFSNVKVASELASFDAALRKHLVER